MEDSCRNAKCWAEKAEMAELLADWRQLNALAAAIEQSRAALGEGSTTAAGRAAP